MLTTYFKLIGQRRKKYTHSNAKKDRIHASLQARYSILWVEACLLHLYENIKKRRYSILWVEAYLLHLYENVKKRRKNEILNLLWSSEK